MTRSRLVLVHAAFAISGVLTTFLGPALPLLQSRFALSDAQAGSLFAAQFAGATLATLGAGAALARFGVGITLGFGFALMTAALAGLHAGEFGWLRPALFLLGAGLGLSVPVTNVWLATQVVGRRKAAVLNSVNLAWGLGAALCTLLIRSSQSSGAGLLPFLAATGILCSAVCVLALRLLPRGRIVAPGAGTDRSVLSAALPYAAFLFLYVGVETAVGGWAATFARRGSARAWFLAPALFWAGLLGGRALAIAAAHRFDERRVLRTGAFLATAAIATWIVSPPAASLVLPLVIGLGLAPLFPTAVALYESRAGAQGIAVSGPLFAMGGIGGAVLPWLVGVASAQSGALGAGLVVVLAAAAAVLALSVRGLDARPSGAGAAKPTGD